MGSSSSKTGAFTAAASSSSAGAGAESGLRKTRSLVGTRGVLHSSCLRRRSFQSGNNNSDSHHHLLVDSKEENRTVARSVTQDHEGQDHHQVKRQQSCGNADSDNDDVDDAEVDSKISSLEDPSPSSTRSRSCFHLFPANLSFRLSRAASFSSSSPHPPSLPSCDHPITTNQACDLPPPCVGARLHHSPASEHLEVFCPDLGTLTTSSLPAASNNDNIVPNQYDHATISNNGNTRMIPRHHTSNNQLNDMEFIQSRRANRRIGAREPVERSVRFSRTLSVGRLRDRVLRRSSFTDGLFGHMQHNRDTGNSGQDDGTQVSGGTTLLRESDGNISLPSPTHSLARMSNSNNRQVDDLDTSRPRDLRYHDRTDFLERRRRLRSQVRALQRLGSRFESLSGHERSCILAGQHRSGRCTCLMSSQARNPNNDTSARASISRIVMLAEALFEVLDEIHQQSVVLSSLPSVSSLGSIPAPKEVVETMPVKMYTELQKHQHEDVTQCYICLVEYEEGDPMRILPCHHEFHRTCVDKWLTEIHRVCPLCRGDVCSSTSTSTSTSSTSRSQN